MSDFSRAAAKLLKISPAVTGAMRGAVAAGSRVVRDEVERRAPVDEGELKATIGDRPLSMGKDHVGHQVHVSAVHALWVERGHGGPHPAPEHPFFRPAVDATEKDASAAVTDAIIQAIRSVTG